MSDNTDLGLFILLIVGTTIDAVCLVVLMVVGVFLLLKYWRRGWRL